MAGTVSALAANADHKSEAPPLLPDAGYLEPAAAKSGPAPVETAHLPTPSPEPTPRGAGVSDVVVSRQQLIPVPVQTPTAEDASSTVRAARARQPLSHRPASLQAVPTPAPQQQRLTLAMPVEGRWRVTCGYRCGLHRGIELYALDLVREDGPTAGSPIFAPVDAEVLAIIDGTVAHCGQGWVFGLQAGSIIVLRFWSDQGVEMRLRLIHVNGATIPPMLRMQGTPVRVPAGTYLGSLAPIGPGCAHLHLSLTVVKGGQEQPHPLIVAGRQLPDCGTEGCWEGTLLP